MSINSKLVTFAQQELVLSHNDTERDRIKASLSHLESVLKNKLGNDIKEFIRFGSFTRNTILPRKYDPNSDVDLLVVFNTTTNRYSPGTYRKWLLDVVNAAYPNSVSKKDFPVVKLELNHIMFDLVPSYTQEYFFGDKTYFIPDVRDGWRSTKPNDINEELTRQNQRSGNNSVRNVIRLCKHWNAFSGYPFESYLMEKNILNVFAWGNEDTYQRFLITISNIAGNKPGVRQALEYIKKYKGDWFTAANEEKQFEWLQKLLPGLN